MKFLTRFNPSDEQKERARRMYNKYERAIMDRSRYLSWCMNYYCNNRVNPKEILSYCYFVFVYCNYDNLSEIDPKSFVTRYYYNCRISMFVQIVYKELNDNLRFAISKLNTRNINKVSNIGDIIQPFEDIFDYDVTYEPDSELGDYEDMIIYLGEGEEFWLTISKILKPKCFEILRKRYIDECSVVEIADYYKLTRTRIYQYLDSAYLQIRKYLYKCDKNVELFFGPCPDLEKCSEDILNNKTNRLIAV